MINAFADAPAAYLYIKMGEKKNRHPLSTCRWADSPSRNFGQAISVTYAGKVHAPASQFKVFEPRLPAAQLRAK